MDSDYFDTEVRVQSLSPTPVIASQALQETNIRQFGTSFLSHESLFCRRDDPTLVVPLAEGGLILPGWAELRVSQEGNILNSLVVLTLARSVLALGCLEHRACFALCQGAAAAAPLWGGSAGKGALFCCCRCVGLAAYTVHFSGSAKPTEV